MREETLSAPTQVAAPAAPVEVGGGAAFGADARTGVVGMLPLLVGAFPFGVAFAAGAVAVGFSPLETVLCSLVVFAGSAQFATVALLGAGAGPVGIVLATFGLNLRHVLYGMSVASWLPDPVRPPRPVLAFGMCDESFGVAARAAAEGNPRSGVLFGANAAMYVTWAAATVVGVALSSVVPDLSGLGLDFVFPVSFLAMLLPMVRTRRAAAVALLAAVLAVLLRPVLGAGFAMLGAALAGIVLGTLLDRPSRSPADELGRGGRAG